MTQKIIDYASAISFDRQGEFATTVSQSRQLKFFHRGPLQSRAVVQTHSLTSAQYREILADISNSKLGPYTLTFPKEVVGPANTQTITVNGASQDDNTLNVSATVNSTQILNKGDIIKIGGVDGSYIVTADVTTDSSGDATVNLDQPVASSPADNAAITVNTACQFSMHLVARGAATQDRGPLGVVTFDSPFTFVEVYS